MTAVAAAPLVGFSAAMSCDVVVGLLQTAFGL